MDVGDESNNGHHRSYKPETYVRRASLGITFRESVENLTDVGRDTLEMVNQQKPRGINTLPFTSCAVFDNSCHRYYWLRPGWLAEERCKPSDRLYRYYYDPLGQAYYSKTEVEDIYKALEENRELIILDD